MVKPAPHAPADKVLLYEQLVASLPEVERKGAANPYTSVNGNMFSQLLPSGRVSLRLPADEREKFIVEHNTRNVEQYGIVQKEYVEVPDELLENVERLIPYFRMSFEYATSLRPKPTTKKRED